MRQRRWGCGGSDGEVVPVVVLEVWWWQRGCEVAVAVVGWCRGRRWRVGESCMVDLIYRETGIVFGFAGNARRKSFPAAEVVAGGGGGWPAVG
nr:hypothetical protein [Tanacetum cinerariifolium]